MGHGDAGVYPGASPETGEQTTEGARRLNQLITRCDVHHNTLGYSGTMGNATRVANNNFYDNSTGIATESLFAGGHPGYPQDGSVFEDNNIYSNNFNSYERRLGRRAARAGPGGHGHLDRAAATATRSGATASGTTGGAARCCSTCPTRCRA